MPEELDRLKFLTSELRAIGAALDYSRFSRLAVMCETYADGLDREIDIQTRKSPDEEREASGIVDLQVREAFRG